MTPFWVKMRSTTRSFVQSVHSRAVKVDIRQECVYLEIRTTERGQDRRHTLQLSAQAARELAGHLIEELDRLSLD